jgi:hypothetical protein
MKFPITYQEDPASKGKGIRGFGRIKVYLEKKLVGSIVAAPVSGYMYIPIRSTLRGETFPTVEEVKRSIEGR